MRQACAASRHRHRGSSDGSLSFLHDAEDGRLGVSRPRSFRSTPGRQRQGPRPSGVVDGHLLALLIDYDRPLIGLARRSRRGLPPRWSCFGDGALGGGGAAVGGRKPQSGRRQDGRGRERHNRGRVSHCRTTLVGASIFHAMFPGCQGEEIASETNTENGWMVPCFTAPWSIDTSTRIGLTSCGLSPAKRQRFRKVTLPAELRMKPGQLPFTPLRKALQPAASQPARPRSTRDIVELHEARTRATRPIAHDCDHESCRDGVDLRLHAERRTSE